MKTGRRASAPSPATIPSSSSAPMNGRPARFKRGLKATLAHSPTALPPADSAAESPRQAHSGDIPTQLRTAIAGVSGYAGGELARLLLNHPRLAATKPIFLGRMETTTDASPSKSEKLLLTDLQPQLATGDSAAPEVVPFNWNRLVDAGIDLLFLATPPEQSREWVPEAIARR